MLFTMTNKTFFYTILVVLIGQLNFAQTNNLSSSPYSIYGLGASNEINPGKTNALGKTGIAMPFDNSINNLNPAAFSNIPENGFYFDIGVKAEKETLFEDGKEEARFNANFSNMAIAFPITKKSGVGITLIPFTNVGYVVLGVETEIDGSTDTFISNIDGSGGLNDIKLNYGYSINKNLRLGVSGSFLWGKITENETDLIEENLLFISEENYYNGFRLGAGFQYIIKDMFSFGSIINFPTKLKGEQTVLVAVNNSATINIEDDLDAFKLPLEVGFGTHFKLNENLFFNIDYRRNFWDATNQSDLIGDYVDQDFFGIGTEFIPKKNGFKYWERINYRAGFNFDNGNLAINNNRVNNFALNIGVGLPLKSGGNSLLNFGYSYGQKGQVNNGLIKENYHLVTFNFSLAGKWFEKRYID